MTQDEGQERQEAKTEDCQEDKRPETEMESTRIVPANGKTGCVGGLQGL